ncbi:MAG: nucleotidyltransferase family protein [Parasporobacterium sp.]|nr:nucleotidyltransferase family protein [Parasporobacterium sp.]
MDREQQFFLNCLKDHIRGEQTILSDHKIDAEQLFCIAEQHSLAGIVYSQCLKFAAQSQEWAGFRKSFLGDVFFYENRRRLLSEIARHFENRGISMICMKGSVFSEYYPVHELRSMGDIDIIIRPEDRQETDRIMREKLGYELFVDHQSVWTYLLEKGQFQIEIHDRMFYDPLANEVDYRAYFDRIWDHIHNAPVYGIDSANLFVPDESLHFLYLMTHTAKHIVNNGSGFRAYLDMVLMCRACRDKLDWAWISAELEKLKLLEFTKTCFRLCERWFGCEMPVVDTPETAALTLQTEGADKEFFDHVTEKTFEDGIFGLGNKANKRAAAAKDIKRSGDHYYAGAFKRVLKKLFPPYGDMQLVPWYSFVDGCPWLLPAAWVYRWFYCAIKKSKHSMALLTEPFVKKKEVMDRQAYLEKWGL